MDRLEQIFEHQRTLTNDFREIELKNDLLDYTWRIPFDLTNSKAQQQLRTTAWFIVEEIGEVLVSAPENQKEEVVDVFHFLVELMLCSGVTPTTIFPSSYGDTDKLTLAYKLVLSGQIPTENNPTVELIKQLAKAMYCLKAKPWKLTPKPTAVAAFKTRLINTFFAFINFAFAYGLTADVLFSAYMRKAQINKERIEGGV
jgi:hypothetical protein